MTLEPGWNRHHRRGFTLLELLVVMGIIMLLMGLLLPAISKSRHAVKVRKANVDVQAIESAILAYRTFYKQWPVASSSDETYGDGSQGNHLIIDQLLNPPSINGRQSEPFVRKADLAFDSYGNAINTFRKAYLISLDLDFDGMLDGEHRDILISPEIP